MTAGAFLRRNCERPPNTEISGEAPVGPCFVRCISLFYGRVNHRSSGLQSGVLGDTSQHAWAYLFAVMERKDEIGRANSREHPVRP